MTKRADYGKEQCVHVCICVYAYVHMYENK